MRAVNHPFIKNVVAVCAGYNSDILAVCQHCRPERIGMKPKCVYHIFRMSGREVLLFQPLLECIGIVVER